jgi:iron-sulfur cluster repair protein YtfE (RIC family)
MRRHRTLVPLSHDHHHALVEARRLRCAAEGPGSSTAASAFLRFFASETVGHFRTEEELLFPAVVDFPEAREPIVQALLEHQRIRARAALLRDRLDDRRALADTMRELGALLAAHVRHEERRLFPLIESLLDDRTLAAVELSRSDGYEAADPQGALSDQPRRTTPANPDATLLFWGAGGGAKCDAAFLGSRRWSARERHR